MKPVMYLIVNSEAGMSPGKLAAQAAHAAVEAYNLSRADLIQAWYVGGHHTKIVLDGGDGHGLLVADQYLKARSFKTKLIIDEGRTEIKPFTPTAIGVEIVDRDDEHVAATFESFRTLKPLTYFKVTESQRRAADANTRPRPIKERHWFRGRR
jgi:peptidyl-tRNA hydrolase